MKCETCLDICKTQCLLEAYNLPGDNRLTDAARIRELISLLDYDMCPNYSEWLSPIVREIQVLRMRVVAGEK
ncbi:MAG: hypothetical protein NUV98_02130 [Candidatus Roizmanbacteria bacterium]|nr:hypothetical protein [Candidatus Roizmanbacteria bacterium]